GLARGSGTRSVAGMAPRSGHYRRPLLDLPREVVARAAADEATADPRLVPWVDPHNADRSFTRVRVRAQVLPALVVALGPGVVGSLARTARLARQDADALDDWADRAWAALRGAPDVGGEAQIHDPCGVNAQEVVPPTTILDLDALLAADLPAAIATRVLRRFLVAAGCPPSSLTAEHVWAVAELLSGPAGCAEVALPGARRARREGSALVVRA
ncbi:MAG: TilS substrate-binding domain-containing protein, partial [Candidatus Nanopelagicales bacterium]